MNSRTKEIISRALLVGAVTFGGGMTVRSARAEAPMTISEKEIGEGDRFVGVTKVVDKDGNGLGGHRVDSGQTMPVSRETGVGQYLLSEGRVVPDGDSIMVRVFVTDAEGNQRVIARAISGMGSPVGGSVMLSVSEEEIRQAWQMNENVEVVFERGGYETTRLSLTEESVDFIPEGEVVSEVTGMIRLPKEVVMRRE